MVYKKETPSSKSQKSNFGGNARFYVAYIQEIWGNEVAERVRNKIEARWQSPEYYYKDFFFFSPGNVETLRVFEWEGSVI